MRSFNNNTGSWKPKFRDSERVYLVQDVLRKFGCIFFLHGVGREIRGRADTGRKHKRRKRETEKERAERDGEGDRGKGREWRETHRRNRG